MPSYSEFLSKTFAVPHFEKMLYDQGQIVNVYLDTFLITTDSFYSFIARDILDYLRRDMIGKEGEIYSAEDADSYEHEGTPRKKEGAFYVWSSEEVISKDYSCLITGFWLAQSTGHIR
jgi:uncharacterized protein YyaL (SSP411 family)